MPVEESQRQKKIASVLQRDLADILQRSATQSALRGILISISKVTVTVDLSIAKVYISIFPNTESARILEGINANASLIKHELAQRTKHQIRRMPQLSFFIDDSLEYIDNIEQSLKGKDNPLKNPELLDKRKKS